MTDRFSCFAELSAKMLLDRDYRLVWTHRENSNYLIIAPHGGKIEIGTSELAAAIACNDLSFYSFEGIRRSNNRDLHITSHRFDEPIALDLATKSVTLIGVHGRQDSDDPETTFLGGRDVNLVASLDEQIRSAGFPTKTQNHRFPAKDSLNICNRGTSGAGAQLELPKSLRDQLTASENEQLLSTYAEAVRCALFRISQF